MNNWTDERLYDQDLPRSFDYPNVPVGAILKGSAKRFHNNVMFIFREHEFTYNTIYRESLRLANGLRKLGIGKGTIVSTHLPTCPQSIVSYYGIILTGATFSPINPYYPTRDVWYQLNDSDAQVVITHESVAKHIQEIYNDTKLRTVIVTGEQEMYSNDNPINASRFGNNWYSFAALKASADEEEFDAAIDPQNDLAHIAYTGGTTGKPKGCMITHANIISSLVQTTAFGYGCVPRVGKDGGLVVEPVEKDEEKYLSKYSNLPGFDINLSVAPLFHVSGVYGFILYPVLLGNSSVLLERFEPTQFLEYIEKYKVTAIAGAPAMWNALLNHPDIHRRSLSTVTNVSSSAAPFAVEEMKNLLKAFPNARYGQGYGQTEATASLTGTVSMLGGLRKHGTVGCSLYDTEIKLIAIDGSSEEPLPVGEKGEICARGPQLMKGYYKNPEETARVIVNGWLRTGDIGVFDKDGLLTIVDRKKDMLIYNGYNVYPGRLEEVLFQHPAVANAAVIGKPAPAAGEIPKAFVILKPGASATEEELMEYVNKQVVHYSKIRELEFVDKLPVTAAGKLSKKALRDMEIQKS